MSDLHRPYRELLGSFVLGHLDDAEAASVRAHLDGCDPCARQAAELGSVARVLRTADVERFGGSPPPPSDLETRIVRRVEERRRLDRLTTTRRFRTRLLSGLAAAAVLVTVLVLADRPPPVAPPPAGGVELVSFTGLPSGAEATAQLTEAPDGLIVHLSMRGMPPGDWLIVVEGRDGAEHASDTFGAPAGGWNGRRTLPIDRAEASVLKIRHRDGSTEFVAPIPAA